VGRRLDENDLSEVFGIELAEEHPASEPTRMSSGHGGVATSTQARGSVDGKKVKQVKSQTAPTASAIVRLRKKHGRGFDQENCETTPQ